MEQVTGQVIGRVAGSEIGLDPSKTGGGSPTSGSDALSAGFDPTSDRMSDYLFRLELRSRKFLVERPRPVSNTR